VERGTRDWQRLRLCVWICGGKEAGRGVCTEKWKGENRMLGEFQEAAGDWVFI